MTFSAGVPIALITMTVVRRIAALLLAAATAGCGGPTATTSSATTPAPTPPTTSVTTSTLPTTTTVAISREARLAIARCRAAVPQLFAARILLDSPTESTLGDAQAVCDETALQLEADNPPVGSVGSKLVLAVAALNLAMAFAATDIALNTFHGASVDHLQKAADDFRAEVDKLL